MSSLHPLEIFIEAARLENFSEAAKSLFVTQPLVSQTIKRLEEDLGVPLFLRKGRNVTLTSEGIFYYQAVSRSFLDLKKARNVLQNSIGVTKGTLRIGSSDTICRHYLLSSLKKFRENFPSIQLDIYTQPSPTIYQMVKNHVIDIGFINGTSVSDPSLKGEKIFEIQETFFTSNDYSKKLHSHKIEELMKHPLVVLSKKSSTRQFMDEILSSSKIHWDPETEVISMDLLIDLISADFGIGFTDKQLLNLKKFITIETQITIPKRHLIALSSKTESFTEISLSFLKIVRETLTKENFG